MAENHSFLEDPAGTREAIMKATYDALCEHGYADLTIQRIGDHFEKSKSLLYHHYDSKDELLLDFLGFMLEEFEETVPREETADPASHLDAILDKLLAEEFPAERHEFAKAMAELRAQAAHDERYRDHFTRHDQFFQNRLAGVIQTGIEEGVFRDVDPDRVAALVVTVITGTMTRRVTTNADTARAVREEIAAYVETNLLAEDPSR